MRGLEQASGARLAEGVVSAGPPGKRLLSNLPGGGETRVLQRELLRLMMRTALICGGGGGGKVARVEYNPD